MTIDNSLSLYIPCLYYIAAIKGNDSEVLEVLIPISQSFGFSYEDMAVITISMYQSGRLSRRYTPEELEHMHPAVSFSCNEMRAYLGTDAMCRVCEYSESYANYNYQTEKMVLSYCCRDINCRLEVERLTKKRPSTEMFKSFKRIGKDDTSLTYVDLNRHIYDFLLGFYIDEQFEKFNTDAYFEQFLKNMTPPEDNPTCFIMNRDYIRKYYNDIYEYRNKEFFPETELAKIVESLFSKKNNKAKRNSSCNKSRTRKSKSKDDYSSNLSNTDTNKYSTPDLPIDDNHNIAEKLQEEGPVINQTQENNTNKIKTDAPVIVDSIQIKQSTEFKINLDNHKEIHTVTTDEDATMFDYDLLKNNVICLELVKYKSYDGLLVYLPKGNLFYFVTFENRYCKDILAYYCNEHKVIKKLSIHTVPIIDYFARYGYKINNYYSIQTMYNILSNESGKSVPINDMELIEKLSKTKISDRSPFYLAAMKKYNIIFNSLIGQLDTESLSLLNDEMFYEQIIGASYSFSNKSIGNNSNPHYISFASDHYYVFNFNDNYICSEDEILVKASYINDMSSEDCLVSAYKKVCVTCVRSGVFEKHNIKLLQLDPKSGLAFLVRKDSFRTFFSLLNRWLVKIGTVYISPNPLINIKASE